jgi:hypothetical protein
VKSVSLDIDNEVNQPAYNARFEMHSPVNAILEPPASVTIPITDDDDAPGLLVGDVITNSESGSLVFPLTLTGVSGFNVTYDYQTESISALNDVDFLATSGSSFFPRGATSASVSVPIFSDNKQEIRETLRLAVTATHINSGRSTLIGIGTIIDDDANVAMDAGWNLVSLPINVNAAARAQLFPGAGTVWTWNAAKQQFRIASDLAAKQGYWIYTDAAGESSPNGEGEPVTTVDLLPGWNLVGPLEPIIAPAAPALTRFYGWDGDFFRAPLLLPNHAYWVYARRATTISVVQ